MADWSGEQRLGLDYSLGVYNALDFLLLRGELDAIAERWLGLL